MVLDLGGLGVPDGLYYVVVFTWAGRAPRAYEGSGEMGQVVNKTGEIDRARVEATTEDEIRQQMIEDGEDVQADYDDWHPSVIQLRQGLGLTQTQIAEMLGMPAATWRNWEQGRTAIDAPGRALLWILAREPAAVLRAMSGKRAA
jgi:putative transcriptional regulator